MIFSAQSENAANPMIPLKERKNLVQLTAFAWEWKRNKSFATSCKLVINVLHN